jgi:predicted RND superfamily exporter protein
MILIFKRHSLVLLLCAGLFLSGCNDDTKTDKESGSTLSTVDPAKDWKLGVALWTFHDVNFPESLNRVDSVGLKYIEPNTFHSAGPELKDTIKEKDSYARLDGRNVVTLNIVKRAGENLIEAADKIKAAVKEMQEKEDLPKDLKVVITGDQSKTTKTSFNELINTIIIGFVLVLIILMFFMGVTNAFFVALSVPLSVFVAFLFLPIADAIIGTSVTLNFIVLFALLFGLGIIVDDAIVVIENTHRVFDNGKVPIRKAAKIAAGEVFVPVFTGTMVG